MTIIDLIPPETHLDREARRRLRKWGSRLGFGCLLAAVLYVGLVQLTSAGATDLRQLSGKYTSLQGRLQHAESLLMERERLRLHREAIDVIRQERSAVWYLTNLGSVLPQESYLISLELILCDETDQEEDCSAGLRLRGRASDHQQVGEIIHQMVATQEFGEVVLISISDPISSEKRREVEFELICRLDEEREGF